MKWSFKEPVLGDMIRMRFGELYHYGVFVSENEVIQFGLAPNLRPGVRDTDVEVTASDIDTFLGGAFLEVAELDRREEKKRRPPKETVEYARGRIGSRGYNLLHNNCEHFAYECVMGEKYCEQSEKVRELFRSLPVLDIYISRIPEKVKMGLHFPAKRREEIMAVSNENVRREKIYATQLLEYAMERSLGVKLHRAELERLPSGKWISPACEFSISHSGGYCAVAISRKPIGVDIELVKKPSSEKFAERVLTERELSEYNLLSGEQALEYLIKKWCEKESIFKAGRADAFVPSAIETGKSSRSELIELEGSKFALGVSAESFLRLKIHKDVIL